MVYCDMDIEVIRNPVYCLKINNIFDEKVNEKILAEAIGLGKQAVKATTLGKVQREDFRSNDVLYYDEIYKNFRAGSDLLINLERLFGKEEFKQILSSSPYPLADFGMTNRHETQVSRYGSDNQHYGFHVDQLGNKNRFITLVYYFYKKPKKWTGGEIQLTNSPIINGEPLEKDPEILTIIPENNTAIIFAGNVAHRVLDTKSPKDWDSGRFSANIWIGYS